jgi:hypothetical protein
MTNFNAWPGLNDHIHGDERREHLGAERVDLYDVLGAIEAGASTHDGMSHYEWTKRICECDEITSIMQHIVKNRHNPAFAEIMNEIEAGIEGWLP